VASHCVFYVKPDFFFFQLTQLLFINKHIPLFTDKQFVLTESKMLSWFHKEEHMLILVFVCVFFLSPQPASVVSMSAVYINKDN